MATSVLGLKTFAASDPVDYNEINENYNKIDNGVKTALQGRAAHNLLDNSDFRNPVNQRGQNAYQFDSGYTIDRWKLHWSGDGDITIHDGYISLYRENYNAYLFQFPANVEKMVGKTYTVAAKVRYNGYIGWIDSTQRTHCNSVHSTEWVIITHTFTVGSATSDIGPAAVEICSSGNLSIELQWAALYEGSYTADTLPAYVPKGYAAELAECQRYYRKFTTVQIAPFYVTNDRRQYEIPLAPPMRISPTVTFDTGSATNEHNGGWGKTGATVSVASTAPHKIVLQADGAATPSDFQFLYANFAASSDL